MVYILFSQPVKPVGPTPLPEHLYASRSIPGRAVASFATRVALWGVLVVAVVGLLVFALSRSPSGSPAVRLFGRALPVPVARVGERTILFRDFQTELDGWTKFYETAGALEAVDEKRLHDRVLERMIERTVVRQLAEELEVGDVTVEVEELYQTIAIDRGSEAKLIEDIDQRYGWTKNVFIEAVVEPIVYARRVDAAVKRSEAFQAVPLETAKQARLDLMAGTADFVAGEDGRSDDVSFLSLDAYPTEAHEALRSGVVGQVTDIIETSDRYLVFLILERQESGEEPRLKTREISVEKADVYDAIALRRAAVNIKVFE